MLLPVAESILGNIIVSLSMALIGFVKLLERRSDPCLQGFSARPAALADGSLDLMTWKCVVPGKAGVRKIDTIHALSIVNP